MQKIFDHLFIFATIAFTVYSQLVMRWQVSNAGPLPDGMAEKITYILALLLNPWVLSGVVATFFAGVSWMLAMTRFEISYAFPFVSLTYIFVLVSGFILFNEAFGIEKIIGSLLIVIGVIVIARG